MADFFQDYTGGNDSNNGTTFALRKKNLTVTLSAGDRNKMAKSPDPLPLKTAAGAAVNATFTDNSPAITLSAATTANVNLCEGSWTAKTNITCSTATVRKAGTVSSTVAVATAFTTGVAAYITTAVGNYSAYDRISLWLRSNIALAGSVIRINLCSDTLGATPVDQFTVTTNLASSAWTPVVVTRNGGGSLGASIQSVSIEFLSDPGTPTVSIDNIVATHALGMNHQRLIGQLSGATDIDHVPVRLINGVDLEVDFGVNTSALTASKGYVGTSGTVAAYYRDCQICTAAQSTTPSAGSSSAHITYSGGWDTSGSMTTQNGITVVRMIPMQTFSFIRAYLDIERLYLVDSDNADWTTANTSDSTHTNIGALNCNQPLILGSAGTNTHSLTNVLVSCQPIGLNLLGRVTGSGLKVHSCTTGLTTASLSGVVSGADFRSCTTAITGAGGSLTLLQPGQQNCTTFISSAGSPTQISILQPTGTGWVFTSGATAIGHDNGILCTGMSSTGLSVSATPGAWGYSARFDSVDGDPNDSREYMNTGTVRTRAAGSWAGTGHTPTGNFWEIAPASIASSTIPCRMKMMTSGIFAAGTYTVAVKTYRTNANVTAKLGVLGGYVEGVASDTFSSAASAAINTAETLSLSVTLTDAGPIMVIVDAYFTSGSTGVVNIDQLTVT